jgi:hypothetical protein
MILPALIIVILFRGGGGGGGNIIILSCFKHDSFNHLISPQAFHLISSVSQNFIMTRKNFMKN